MQRIFQDERRELASFPTNPFGTGLLFPAAASRMSCVEPATRQHPLLTAGKSSSRRDNTLTANRP